MLGLFKRQTSPQPKVSPKKADPKDQRPAVVQPFRQASTLLVGGGLAVAALAISGIGNWSKDIGAWFQENLAVTQSAPKVDIQSLTINKIRGASELTTLVFSTEAIVPTGRELQLGQVVIGSTKLLYIAHGEVRAGIDLADVKRDDVVWDRDDNTLTITLPPPKILDSKIDVTRSRVYDYNRGFLGLGPDVAPQLMVLAQQKALETVIQSACDRGLMAQAGDRAKTAVGQLLGGSLTNTNATTAALPNLNQPVIEIIVPEVDNVTCAAAQREHSSEATASSAISDGAIAPDTVPKTDPVPAPNSGPITTPSSKNVPPPDAPLPVPALP